MKKIARMGIAAVAVAFCAHADVLTNTWVSGSTDWSAAASYVENRTLNAGDVVVIPSGVTATVSVDIVEKPNDWSKTMKTIEGLSNTDLLKLEFWTGFNDAMSNNADFTRNFHARKASPQHWYDLSIGSSAYHVALTINTQKQNIGTEIYISDDKELFEQFKKHKEEISAMLNSEVEWREAKKACRILITTDINPRKRESWPKAYNWFLEKAIVYKEIASKYGD